MGQVTRDEGDCERKKCMCVSVFVGGGWVGGKNRSSSLQKDRDRAAANRQQIWKTGEDKV